VITGGKTNNGQVPGATNLGVLPVVANAAPPTYTEGNQAALSTDLGGLLRVAVVSGGGTGGTSSSFGAAFPATGTAVGLSDTSGLMRPGLAVDADTGAGVQWVQRVILAASNPGGSFEIGTAAAPLRISPTSGSLIGVFGQLTNNSGTPGTSNVGVLPCVATAAAPTYGEGFDVTCSVNLGGAERVVGTGTAGTANAGVLTVQGIASMTPVQVSQATAANLNATIVGTKTNNNATPGATNVGVLPAVATTAAPSYTDTDQVTLSTDLAGSLRVAVVSGSTGNAAASATGSAVPAQADYQGLNVSGTLRGQTGTNTSGVVYAADVNMVAAPPITYNATQPTKTDGQTVTDFQITSRGALVVNPGVETFPVSAVITTGSAQMGHLEANQSVNLAQINGVTPTMGSGNATSATLRVILAANQDPVGIQSQSNPTSTMNSSTALQGVITANGFVFDDTAPTTVTENNFGMARMSANRNQYATLRDAAGNERGVNVNASNELLVSPTANAAVNVAQMNGITVTMNNGVAGTGVQRVAIASDNTVLPAVGAGATGAAVPANAVYPGAQDGSGNLIGDIDCTLSKIYDASTSGNTELVALSGSKHIYVCGYELFSAGTVNVSLVSGTGTACASAASGATSTGTSGASAALTPAWEFTAQTGKLSAYPTHGFLLDAGSANALCLKTSGGVAVQAQVFYKQQ
jgi:hypothetical protein